MCRCSNVPFHLRIFAMSAVSSDNGTVPFDH